MTNNKKTTYSLGIVLLAAVLGVLVGLMFGPKLSRDNRDSFYDFTNSSPIDQMMSLVENTYVDSIDRDSLTTMAMSSLLSSLDPHSTFLPPKSFEEEREMMTGSFEGIGINLLYLNDTVFISNVHAGGPAHKAGVHAGDRIIYVDTTKVSGAGIASVSGDVVSLIRGPRHSKVTLKVNRDGSNKLIPIKVSRDVIMHPSIPAAVMLNKQTGYIRISHFSETTAHEFHSSLLQLLNEGMQHLVLDLRGNSGGVLESSIYVVNELLPQGDLIVYTQGAHHRRKNVKATSGGLFETGKLTVMIDEYSASASEVVAGAIQDNDRGLIMGRRSFGKGLVQQQFELSNGGAMLLTIARYYSPSGRCIQRPYDKGTDAYYTDYLNRLLNDYASADSLLSAPGDTTQVFYTKKGRKVYGGGGIQPDVFLSYLIDTHFVYWNRLISKNVMEEVLFDELYHHYNDLKKRFPTVEAFEKGYKVSDATWQRVLTLGEKKGVPRNNASIAKYDSTMRNRYKALMAQSLFDDNAFYKVNLPYDQELQKALQRSK